MRGLRWPAAFCFQRCQGIVCQIWFVTGKDLKVLLNWVSKRKQHAHTHTHTHAPKQIPHLVERASTISQTRGLHDCIHIERRRDVDLCHTLKSGCSHAFSTYWVLHTLRGSAMCQRPPSCLPPAGMPSSGVVVPWDTNFFGPSMGIKIYAEYVFGAMAANSYSIQDRFHMIQFIWRSRTWQVSKKVSTGE